MLKKFSIILLFSLVILSFMFKVNGFSKTGVDLIKSYTVEVEPQEDGSLNIDYNINWKVLNDSEGPLTFIDVGVPNKNFEILHYESSGKIAKIEPKNNGSFNGVEITFANSYHAGDEFNVYFSIHQNNMVYDSNNYQCIDFTPGWFEDIKVEDFTLIWKLKDGMREPSNISPSNYTKDRGSYIFKQSLKEGEKFNTTFQYEDAFTNVNYSEKNTGGGFFETIFSTLLIPFIFIIAIIYSIIHWFNDKGGPRGGGGTRIHNYGGYVHRSSCACASHCACACACACAGGGRAGCFRKGFMLSKDSLKNKQGK